ncbi:RagB/SusD family nutrient uptake outer membrane protein [Flavisolibacter nicotianae]|uniref:RagB/SusD family nutrient uptake outer membrane protein n=1 Tax=Flavisolibacter nicotianae TaxID=2364882 RepID=UPI0013C4DF31|nr:RagB/SusD family nutrient uptake outer membrane protein [Flavisolibacter nicotianae]
MKTIKIAALALLLSGSFAACKKDSLFQEPTDAISDADAYSTAARIDKAAIGMYDALQNANYFSGRILIYADQRGLDATPSTYFGTMGSFTTLTSSDGTVASAWQGAYRTIYTANLFLKSYAANKGLLTQAKADQYEGEAKFIRAICYWYLVNLWSQDYNFTADASHPGVPLVLDASDEPFSSSNNLPRATVKQVYAQMETDLLDAEAKLPLTSSDAFTKVARATKGAARAMLTRLYLYKGDYAKTVTYADAVINSNLYSLNADPKTTFTDPYTSNESIFSVAMSGGDNPNTNNSLGQHYGTNPGRGDISVTSDYVALMNTATDKRYLNLIKQYQGSYWTTKYSGLTTDFVPVVRYAEVLLNKAEALARMATGVDATALALVQQVRSRSNGGLLVVTTKQELIDAIIKEKRIELAFEGFGITEFNRLHLDLPAHGIVNAIPYGSNLRVFPLPKYDMDKNPNLVQNPGY